MNFSIKSIPEKTTFQYLIPFSLFVEKKAAYFCFLFFFLR